jgi:hypothetical protein
MKITHILTGLLMLTISQKAFCGMTVADFQAKSKTQAVEAYVLGVAGGLNAANSALAMSKSAPLFCLPPFLKLSTANYKEIIALGINDLGSNKLDRQSMDIDLILLKKMTELYPCGFN